MDGKFNDVITEDRALHSRIDVHANDISTLRQELNSLKDRFIIMVNEQARATPTPGGTIDPNLASASSQVPSPSPPGIDQVTPLHEIRLVNTIPKLKDDKSKFDLWEKRIISIANINYSDAEDTLGRADGSTDIIQEAPHLVKFSRELYSIIQATIEEECEAEDIFNSVKVGSGLEAYRLIKQRYDPQDKATDSSKLQSILHAPQVKLYKHMVKCEGN